MAEFLTSYPDPAGLIAGISTVEGSPIAIGTLNLEVGDTWAAADIETLQSEMDGFVSAYVPSGDTSTTVDDLELMLNDANNQLDSAGSAVTDATALRDDQAVLVALSESVLQGLESTLAATQADLQVAQADVIASMVVKTGTGTGSAQVVGLDPADLVALGDGQVTVESTATDLAGNTASDTASFELDTTLNIPTVVVDDVINDAESGSVAVALSGVDGDVDLETGVVVTLTDVNDLSVSASYDALSGTWIADGTGLTDGQVTVDVQVTDDAGNTASAATGFDLDTTADESGDLAITVGDLIREPGSDRVTLFLSLEGVDGDVDPATGVVVTLTDSESNAVTAAYDAESGVWIGDMSGLTGHQVTVSSTITDDAGNVSSVSTVAMINRAPEFAASAVDLSVDEGLSVGDVVYQASATDSNGDGLVYSLSGPDADLMQIDDLSGRVRFNESPDYESGKTMYEFTVVASDGELTASQDVTLNVNDVNESLSLCTRLRSCRSPRTLTRAR